MPPSPHKVFLECYFQGDFSSAPAVLFMHILFRHNSRQALLESVAMVTRYEHRAECVDIINYS